MTHPDASGPDVPDRDAPAPPGPADGARRARCHCGLMYPGGTAVPCIGPAIGKGTPAFF